MPKTTERCSESETWEKYRDAKRIRAASRRREALQTFDEARALAAKSGLTLVTFSSAHFALQGPGCRWQINIYPGNGRLYADRQKGHRAPYLKVPPEWTLLDVVNSAVEQVTVEGES